MMTSGLVVTLVPNSPEAASAVASIRAAPALTVGDRAGSSLTVALEAADAGESERWHDWLRRLPGVVDTEVVFVHWDESEVRVADAGA